MEKNNSYPPFTRKDLEREWKKAFKRTRKEDEPVIYWYFNDKDTKEFYRLINEEVKKYGKG